MARKAYQTDLLIIMTVLLSVIHGQNLPITSTVAFSYKTFELNLFFTGVYGNQLLNLTRYQNEMPLGSNGPYINHYKTAANFAVPTSNNRGRCINS